MTDTGYLILTESTDKWTGQVSCQHSPIYRTRAEAERIDRENPPIPRPWFSEQRQTVVEVRTHWPDEAEATASCSTIPPRRAA